MVQGFETATNSFTDALASKMRGFGNAVQRLSGFANPPVPGSFGGFNAQVGPGQSPVFNRPVTDFGQGDEPSFSQSEAGQLLRLLFVPTSETPSIPSGVSADEVSDFTRKMYPQDDSGQLLLTSGQAQLLTAQNVPGPKGVFNKLAAISQHFDPSQFGMGRLFTGNPKKFRGLRQFLDDPNEAEGLFHVTTDLKSVRKQGIKSRRMLRKEGVTGVPGLGGGASDEAPGLVSTTFSSGKAGIIEEKLKLAARAARGEAKASEIFDKTMDQFLSGDFVDDDVRGLLNKWGVPDNVVNDEFLEGLEAALDRAIKTKRDRFEFLVQLEDTVATSSGDELGMARVGITTDFSVFEKLDPKNIGTVQVRAKKTAKPDIIRQESEMRFEPSDLRLRP